MPLFHRDGNSLVLIKQKKFANEKELQQLVEQNLKIIFNCRFVASEFYTGQLHSGRIDTLALSEDNNPVIIEYKAIESSELINQSLYYLSWIKDHKGDFQLACNQSLGDVEVDWNDVRVICIAPGYKKYDLHAVQVMGANIELWEYRIYEDGSFVLEEVLKRSSIKNIEGLSAGKKAAETRKTGVYTVEEHFNKTNDKMKMLLQELREFILDIDETIEEAPKKLYIAYKFTQNFVCVEVKKDKIVLFLKINPDEIDKMPAKARDVRGIGHFGTGDFEYTLDSREGFEEAQYLIMRSFQNIVG